MEDMFRASVLEFKDSWVMHLSLVEFVYNNYQASIDMTPYEALYGRKCRTPLCWDEVCEQKLNDVELIETTLEKIKIIRERLKQPKIFKRVMQTHEEENWNLKWVIWCSLRLLLGKE